MDLNEVIQAIAKRHGIVLNKNDPVLMLYTLLECFQKNLSDLQEAERIKFLAALELEHDKWTEESQTRAERILNASLEHARQSAADVCETASASFLARLEEWLAGKLEAVEQNQLIVYRLALANLAGAVLLALAGLFIWLVR